MSTITTDLGTCVISFRVDVDMLIFNRVVDAMAVVGGKGLVAFTTRAMDREAKSILARAARDVGEQNSSRGCSVPEPQKSEYVQSLIEGAESFKGSPPPCLTNDAIELITRDLKDSGITTEAVLATIVMLRGEPTGKQPEGLVDPPALGSVRDCPLEFNPGHHRPPTLFDFGIDQWVTLAESAKYLGITRRQLENHVRRGEITAWRNSHRAKSALMFKPTDVHLFGLDRSYIVKDDHGDVLSSTGVPPFMKRIFRKAGGE